MSDLLADLPGADAPFFRALAQGQLKLPRCAKCMHWHWPAVFRCGECGGWDIGWQAVEMRGRIFSHARNWHRFGGSEGLELPYVTLLVELPQCDGRRLLGLLDGDDRDLRIGAPVRGRIDTVRFGEQKIPGIRWRITGAQP